jgi:flagellar motor switch protein FliM
LQIGTTIVFDSSPDDDITLTCQGIPVFEGNIGCVEENVAILVNKVINKKIRDES